MKLKGCGGRREVPLDAMAEGQMADGGTEPEGHRTAADACTSAESP